MKKYTIVAGVNGSGKTTLYQTGQIQKSELRINADEILVELGGDWKNTTDVLSAGKEAVERLSSYIEGGKSFNQETTLCGKAILNNISKAKEKGYLIEVHYIGVSSVELAKERVAKRVSEGGHGVSDADIERRFEQSFVNLKKIIPVCNLVALYDNTEEFRRFAIYKDGALVRKSHKVPKWFERVQ